MRGRWRWARVAALARAAMEIPPPPGPFRPGFWRSPLRGPWLTSVFGLVLLIGIPVVFVAGLLSYAAYNPGLGPLNDQTPGCRPSSPGRCRWCGSR